MDPTLLEAMRAAAEANPENVAIRLHYASLLVQAERHADALEQTSLILAKDPANVEALKLAATAAEATGDATRAQGYRKLYEALSWNSAKGMIEDVIPSFDDIIEPDDERERSQPIREGGPDDDDLGLDIADRWITERPEVKLSDVAGMESAKKRLNLSFLGPMRNPELMKAYGKSLRGGLLLYGPPGCGKTYIARAIAGELGAKFLSIGLTDVVDMWLGQSEKNLHALFETARRNKPCVLFMDELDALGRKRSLMRHQAGTGIINQLLSELDGVEFDNDGLYFLAATNHPWDVDSALRRPGRLDRMVLVLPPDAPAREAIIQRSLRDKPQERIDTRLLAEKTEDFSGADVTHLCDSAAEEALSDAIETGKVRPIRMGDFKNALKEVRPSTRSWLDTAKNHAIYANEGGVYDDLLTYLKQRRML